MPYEQLIADGRIKPYKARREEIRRLLKVAGRDLATAERNLADDRDWAYTIACNAISTGNEPRRCPDKDAARRAWCYQPRSRGWRMGKRIDARSGCLYNVPKDLETRKRTMRAEHSIGVRELTERAAAVVREVREKGVAVDITYRGQVVAQLVPVPPRKQSPREVAAIWADLDQLAAEIGAAWPRGISAAEAVHEVRRAL